MSRFVCLMARSCTIGGALSMAIMMLATDWDILARQIANKPLPGVVELVEVTVLACAMLGLPEAFLRDQQIRIDLLDNAFPPKVFRIVKAAGLLLSLVFLALLARHVWPPVVDAWTFGDVKYDLGIPLWPLYALIVFGFGASFLTCLSVFWTQVIRGKDTL